MTQYADPSAGTVLEVDGLAVNIVREGAGDPLVLVHGAGPGGTARYSFAPLIPHLAEKFDVIAIDMPGYGLSDKLPVADTPRNVAEHLRTVLGILGVERAVLVGHSRGGRISVELTDLAPNLVGQLVILSSGSAAPGAHMKADGTFTDAAQTIVNFGADGDTGFDAFVRTRHLSVYDPASLSEEYLRPYYDAWVASGRRENYIAQMKVNNPLTFYHVDDAEQFKAKLRGITCPVSVIWGREDQVSPYDRSFVLMELIEDLEYHLFTRCGHCPPLEYPEATAELIASFVRRRG